MNYQLPSYHDLKKNTQNLNKKFNQIANRYIPPSLDTLLEKIKKLQNDYSEITNTRTFMGFFADRERRSSQIASISNLTSKLKKTRNIDHKKAQRIILGACFYRVERLKTVHDAKHKYLPSVVKQYIPATTLESTLCRLLKEILDIKHDNKLDDQTLITNCQDYADYLMELTLSERKAYLDANPHLFANLTAIIEEHKVGAERLRAQMRIIKFIQSIELTLDKVSQTIKTMMPLLTKKFSHVVDEDSAEETQYFLRTELDMIDEPIIKNFIQTFQLLPDKLTPKGVPVLQESGQIAYLSCQDYIQTKLEVMNQCILFGAYMMAFAQCGCLPLSSTLHILLEQTLEITASNPFAPHYQELDLEIKIKSLQYLDKFHAITADLEYSAWDLKNGKEYFERALQIEIAKPRQESLLSYTG